jgi:hypothetical protein
MHMLIAFVVIAATVFLPLLWAWSFVSAMGLRDTNVLMETIILTLVIAAIGTGIFEGLWLLFFAVMGP